MPKEHPSRTIPYKKETALVWWSLFLSSSWRELFSQSRRRSQSLEDTKRLIKSRINMDKRKKINPCSLISDNAFCPCRSLFLNLIVMYTRASIFSVREGLLFKRISLVLFLVLPLPNKSSKSLLVVFSLVSELVIYLSLKKENKELIFSRRTWESSFPPFVFWSNRVLILFQPFLVLSFLFVRNFSKSA